MNYSPIILRRQKRFSLIVCVVLWVCAFVASHVPLERMPKTHVGDKWLHFVGFFGLAGVFLLTLTAYGVARLRRAAIVICVMVGYAAFDEGTQPLFNRHAAFSDWLADVCGAAAAVIVLEVLLLLLEKLRRRSARSI